jgi:hypothetical protein
VPKPFDFDPDAACETSVHDVSHQARIKPVTVSPSQSRYHQDANPSPLLEKKGEGLEGRLRPSLLSKSEDLDLINKFSNV